MYHLSSLTISFIFVVEPSNSNISSGTQSPDQSRGTVPSGDMVSISDLPSASDPDASPRDWHSFIRAYSNGLWDPFKTPLPPIPTIQESPVGRKPSSPGASRAGLSLRRVATAQAVGMHTTAQIPSRIDLPPRPSPQPPRRSPAAPFPFLPNRQVRARSPSVPPSPSIAQRRGTGIPDLRRTSASDEAIQTLHSNGPFQASNRPAGSPMHSPYPDRLAFVPSSAGGSDPNRKGDAEENSPPSIQHAATMRLAGAGVDVAPLSLPSPELELMDPMRRARLTAAGTHSSSGAERHSRISKQDKIRNSAFDKPSFGSKPGTPLEPIQGSPASSKATSPAERPPSTANSPSEKRKNIDVGYFPQFSASLVSPSSATTYHSFASSVPVGNHKGALETNDYFGLVTVPSNPSGSSSSARNSVIQARTPDLKRASIVLPQNSKQQLNALANEFGSFDDSAVCGTTRDASEVVGIAGAWVPSPDSSEVQFGKLGYLSAPMAPDESRRLQALYRFVGSSPKNLCLIKQT